MFLSLGIILTISLTGCSKKEPDKRPVCYVGGTMYPVMQKLAKMFKEDTGIEVRLDKAGSGDLMVKIEQQVGKDSDSNADLYVCHDPYLDRLFARGLGEEGWTVAAITPVIVVQPGNPKKIKSLKDLADKKDLKIVLTHFTHSTLGWMLPTLFRKAGVDFEKEIKPLKSLETHRSGGDAANKVKNKNRDVAVVWNAVAHLRKPDVEIIEIPADQMPSKDTEADMVTSATTKIAHDISTIRVTVATVKGSKRAADAKKFLDFVRSKESQKVWKEFGFTEVSPEKEF